MQDVVEWSISRNQLRLKDYLHFLIHKQKLKIISMLTTSEDNQGNPMNVLIIIEK
jgi:hypothetical protein